eukprot:789547-Rhodomonas_salina.1
MCIRDSTRPPDALQLPPCLPHRPLRPLWYKPCPISNCRLRPPDALQLPTYLIDRFGTNPPVSPTVCPTVPHRPVSSTLESLTA